MTIKEIQDVLKAAGIYLGWIERKQADPAITEPAPPLPVIPPVKRHETGLNASVSVAIPAPRKTAAQRLYEAAKSQIGKDLSNSAPNELGCAESMSRVIRMVYPNFPIIISTAGLNLKLMNSYHFERSANPIKGCIAIAPTQGAKVGHCWVWGDTWAMSNTSKTGKWQANYRNVDVIKDAKRRGLPLHFYIPL